MRKAWRGHESLDGGKKKLKHSLQGEQCPGEEAPRPYPSQGSDKEPAKGAHTGIQVRGQVDDNIIRERTEHAKQGHAGAGRGQSQECTQRQWEVIISSVNTSTTDFPNQGPFSQLGDRRQVFYSSNRKHLVIRQKQCLGGPRHGYFEADVDISSFIFENSQIGSFFFQSPFPGF